MNATVFFFALVGLTWLAFTYPIIGIPLIVVGYWKLTGGFD